jgi:hypothetical protein
VTSMCWSRPRLPQTAGSFTACGVLTPCLPPTSHLDPPAFSFIIPHLCRSSGWYVLDAMPFAAAEVGVELTADPAARTALGELKDRTASGGGWLVPHAPLHTLSPTVAAAPHPLSLGGVSAPTHTRSRARRVGGQEPIPTSAHGDMVMHPLPPPLPRNLTTLRSARAIQGRSSSCGGAHGARPRSARRHGVSRAQVGPRLRSGTQFCAQRALRSACSPTIASLR